MSSGETHRVLMRQVHGNDARIGGSRLVLDPLNSLDVILSDGIKKEKRINRERSHTSSPGNLISLTIWPRVIIWSMNRSASDLFAPVGAPNARTSLILLTSSISGCAIC